LFMLDVPDNLFHEVSQTFMEEIDHARRLPVARKRHSVYGPNVTETLWGDWVETRSSVQVYSANRLLGRTPDHWF
jgi:hypothetical protein